MVRKINLNKFLLILTMLFCLFSYNTVAKSNDEIKYVDFELVNHEPVVVVSVNNKLIKLSIDTGADNDELCIIPETINKLGLNKLPTTSKSLDMEGITYENNQYQIKELHIGNYKFSNVVVSEEKRNYVIHDGIIGNKLFEKYKLLLDYKNCKLALLDYKEMNKILSKNESWVEISYTKSEEGIVLPVKIGDKDYRFVLDTGAAVTDGDNAYGIIKKLNQDGVKKNIYEDVKENGLNILNVKKVYIDKKDFGKMSFVKLDFPDMFTQDGLIGYNIFKERKVIIDYSNQKIYFDNSK